MTSATLAEGVKPTAQDKLLLRRSLAEGLAGNRNALGIIRLVLASAVIFSHAFYIGGWGHDPFLDFVRNQESTGGIAVLGFFAISGYLITKSGMGTDALQFIWRRVLRIFPAFWAVLVVAAFMVGPIVWVTMGRPIINYFNLGAGGPFAYVYRNMDLTIRQYGVLDIFVDTPYGSTAGAVFNGSLWTLTYEWGAYLIVFAFVLFGVLERARILVPILTAFYFIAEVSHKVVPLSAGQILPYFGDHYRVSLPLIFLYGACLAIYSKKIVLDWRLALLAAGLVGGSLHFGGFSVLGYPALAYLVMWLATALPAKVQWIGAKNDYSYGMYVYGFLIQQLTAYLGWYQWGYWPWTIVCVALTAAFAWLSWHGIEKRALSLKDWGPGHGIGFWAAWIQELFPRLGLRFGKRRKASKGEAAAE